MQLHPKTALVFAATGAISQAVARTLAEHGAHVTLVAREPDALRDFANEIGAEVHLTSVDILDPASVDAVFADLHRHRGSVDIVFNGIGPRAADIGSGTLAADLDPTSLDDALRSIVTGQFITAAAAHRLWREHDGAGTVILLSSSLAKLKMGGMSGITAASAAVEGLTRGLAAELAPLGGRAVCVTATALPETRTIHETTALQAARLGIPAEAMAEGMRGGYLLDRGPSLAEVGQLVAFLASDAGAVLNSHIIDADRGATGVL